MSWEILTSEIRGSVGEITYSRNHYGPYQKTKLIQPPSSSPGQIIRRDAIAEAVTDWQMMSDDEYTRWKNFVDQRKKLKAISRKVRLSAFNEFCSRYVNRSILESTATGFSPLPSVRMHPHIESVSNAITTLEINWSSIDYSPLTEIAIYATPPLSAGIYSPNLSAFKLLATFTPGSNSGSADIFSVYDAVFNLSSADNGKKIFVCLKAINSDNFAAGQKSYGFSYVEIPNPRTSWPVQLYNDDYYSGTRKSFVKTLSTEPSHQNKIRGKLWLFYRY